MSEFTETTRALSFANNQPPTFTDKRTLHIFHIIHLFNLFLRNHAWQILLWNIGISIFEVDWTLKRNEYVWITNSVVYDLLNISPMFGYVQYASESIATHYPTAHFQMSKWIEQPNETLQHFPDSLTLSNRCRSLATCHARARNYIESVIGFMPIYSGKWGFQGWDISWYWLFHGLYRPRSSIDILKMTKVDKNESLTNSVSCSIENSIIP